VLILLLLLLLILLLLLLYYEAAEVATELLKNKVELSSKILRTIHACR
jgi:hypothetical protein